MSSCHAQGHHSLNPRLNPVIPLPCWVPLALQVLPREPWGLNLVNGLKEVPAGWGKKRSPIFFLLFISGEESWKLGPHCAQRTICRCWGSNLNWLHKSLVLVLFLHLVPTVLDSFLFGLLWKLYLVGLNRGMDCWVRKLWHLCSLEYHSVVFKKVNLWAGVIGPQL